MSIQRQITLTQQRKEQIFFDSKLLNTCEDKELISQWIDLGKIKTTLLYRGTEDGFTYPVFESKVKY